MGVGILVLVALAGAIALAYEPAPEPAREIAIGPQDRGRYRMPAFEPLVLSYVGRFEHGGSDPPRVVFELEHRYLERGVRGVPVEVTTVLNGARAYEFRYEGDQPIDRRWTLPLASENVDWSALRSGSNDIAWYVNATPPADATGILLYGAGPLRIVG